MQPQLLQPIPLQPPLSKTAMFNTDTSFSTALKTTCASRKKCGFGIFGRTSGRKRLRIHCEPLCVWNVKKTNWLSFILSGIHICHLVGLPIRPLFHLRYYTPLVENVRLGAVETVTAVADLAITVTLQPSQL